MAEGKTRPQILAALAAADRARARALRRLAALPVGEDDAGFVFGRELQEVLRAQRARLAGSHGYCGHAIGWKVRGTQVQPQPGITVFVRRKLSKAQLARVARPAVPRWLTTGRGAKLETDVVAMTTERRDSITPGASIEPRRARNAGTLACFAWDAAQQLVGVTAGHVAQRATKFVTPAGGAIEFGRLGAASLSPVDAATIVITSGWSQVFPDGSHVVGVRPLTEHDLGRPVYVYGAETGGWSAGSVVYLAPWITGWNLADAIVYTSPTKPGDSGGPVVDEHGYLVGVHVGRGVHQGTNVAIAGAIGRIARELKITPTF